MSLKGGYMGWILIVLALPLFIWGAIRGRWNSPQIRLGVIMLIVAIILIVARI